MQTIKKPNLFKDQELEQNSYYLQYKQMCRKEHQKLKAIRAMKNSGQNLERKNENQFSKLSESNKRVNEINDLKKDSKKNLNSTVEYAKISGLLEREENDQMNKEFPINLTLTKIGTILEKDKDIYSPKKTGDIKKTKKTVKNVESLKSLKNLKPYKLVVLPNKNAINLDNWTIKKDTNHNYNLNKYKSKTSLKKIKEIENNFNIMKQVI